MAEYTYFNIWDNHFKMWGYEAYQNEENGSIRICFYWGKIADTLQKLQAKEKHVPSCADAYSLIQKKTDEKLRKGYVAVNSTDYSKYSCGEISLSQLIDIIESQKRGVVER